jgi:dihydrolipoamide dehydrogenase
MAQSQKEHDLVVIGSGPGGYTAAIRAAQLGMNVAIVEAARPLGGVCLNWGCIPTKALLKQAEMYKLFQRADEFGLSVEKLGFDWKKIIERSREVAGGLASGVEYLMKKNSIEVIKGRGRITPTRQIDVQTESGHSKRLAPKNILIATGSSPVSIPGVQIDGVKVISSKEAMVQDTLPKSIAIIGAGAIGVEFAYFFNSFGTEVTLIEALDQVLPREDAEIAQMLSLSLSEQGIDVRTGVRVQGVDTKGKGMVKVRIRPGGGGEEEIISAEKVLMAVGVVGNASELGLEAAGIRRSKAGIEVNGRLETSVKGIYAIGDVIGPPQLAHAASAEGIAAVEFMAGHEREEIDYSNIPSCTYCQPQVASVGLTEAQAKDAGHEVKVGRFPFAASGKARAVGDTEGLVKLVFDAKLGEVLGASIIGSEATELIAEIGLARTMEATYSELLKTVHAHPTLSEAVMEAAGVAFGEGISI